MPSRSTDQLPIAAANVRYEHEMLSWGVALIAQPWGGQDFNAWRSLDGTSWEQARQNLTVEATLVHIRNLADFYASEPTHDDVVASHFCAAWEPIDLISNDDRRAMNKRLQHLTFERTIDRRRYPVDDWCREALAAHARLVDLVEPASPELASALKPAAPQG